ncbi:MAG: 3-hydroxyacyl-CoA dehydrogenase NAD-binding domain-containing protein, partial [Candidatus Thermoplasmatota archaeon]|nr:3-hydroxyacyl-CoA dehydrogenase NAD-binding domain-containing protein [Candidatus Thermoplasmatota archaeon]
MTVKKIGVIGAGQMGHGIALVAAKAGFNVILRDIKDNFVKNGISKIERFLDKSIEKGKMTIDEKEKILSNLKGTTKLEDLKNVDLVIEAIFENIKVKKELFEELDKVCKKETY